MKPKRLEMSKPIPVQLDKALRDRIERLSERLGEAKSTVMRIAMRVGLDQLEKALASETAPNLHAIAHATHEEPTGPQHRPQASFAELPPAKASSEKALVSGWSRLC